MVFFAAAFSLLLATLVVVNSLDIELIEMTCDTSKEVTASIAVQCGGTSRCTFGDTARIFGTMTYSGTESTGISYSTVYMTADMNFLTLSYNLFQMAEMDLCYDNVVYATYDDDATTCPGDGTYDFEVYYDLPPAADESASWLATGWQGVGNLYMYSQVDESMLIGECTMDLKTYVTPTDNFSIIQTPSAAAVVGILAGLAATTFLICFYLACCRRTPTKTVNEQDVTIKYRNMSEEMDDETFESKSRATDKTNDSSVVSEL